MNKINLDYQYYLDICDAIAFYTKNICKINKKAFFYRGSNLRFAVERCIYIHCINSKELYINYIAKKNKKTTKLNNFVKYENDIFNIIFSKENYKFNYSLKIVHSLTKKIIHSLRLIKIFKRKKSYFFSQKGLVIFNITNIKFLNYIKPLLRNLENNKKKYAFQTGSDENLAISIKNFNHKILNIPHQYNFINHIFSSIFLSDFLELLCDFDNNIFSLKKTNPKCIVTLEGNSPQDIIALEVAKKISIPCFCIQQGWAPLIHNGFRNMDFTEYFVWGKEFQNLLEKYNPKQRFIVTGSPYLSNLKSYKKIDKLKTISFFLQDVSPLINRKAFLKFFELIILCSEKFPELNIIVKEHPSSKLHNNLKFKLSTRKNITFYNGKSTNLNEILDYTDITLSIFSTVILESIAKEKVPVICSFSSIPRYMPYIVDNKCAIEIFNINDALEIIKKFISKPQELNVYTKNIAKIKDNLFQKTNACKIITNRII